MQARRECGDGDYGEPDGVARLADEAHDDLVACGSHVFAVDLRRKKDCVEKSANYS